MGQGISPAILCDAAYRNVPKSHAMFCDAFSNMFANLAFGLSQMLIVRFSNSYQHNGGPLISYHVSVCDGQIII